MKGPIFAVTAEGRRDAAIHRDILSRVKFSKSKAKPHAVARGKSLGLTIEQINKLLEK